MIGGGGGIEVSGLHFAYEGQSPLFARFNLNVSPGSRCLLIGANGSGKTTLLKILAGKHMVGGRDVVRVLNSSAFHDTQLVCSGDLSYLGGSWSKTVGSAGEIPLQGDFSAEHMIFGVEGIDPVRREKLIDLLDIDLQWRMHKVSDGQRRRVQICMGLLYPYKLELYLKFFAKTTKRYNFTMLWKIVLESSFSSASRWWSPIIISLLNMSWKSMVLLLDEVTVDLDVVTRMDLLDFFKEECELRGAIIVYATHIFDGLESWATHLAYIQDGELLRSGKMSDIVELKNADNLLSVVESWLRSEVKLPKKEPVAPINSTTQASRPSPFDSSPFRSSRHMAYYR